MASKSVDTIRPGKVTDACGHSSAAGQAGARESIAGHSPASHEGASAPSVRKPFPDWFVLHHRADDGARTRLAARRGGFEVHWPRLFVRRPRQDDRAAPFFPGYMFVRPLTRSASLLALRNAPQASVIDIVGMRSMGRPITAPSGFVEALIAKAGAIDGVMPARDDELLLAAPVDWEEGEQVRVTEGPFAGLMAEFRRLADDERVEVMLTVFGAPRPVTVARKALERAD